MIPVVYSSLCPICGGDLDWEEIREGVCRRKGDPLGDSKVSNLSREFEEYFQRATGFQPRALQRMWARRVLSGYSFAAIAPTGIGKTMFGTVMAAFLAERNKRSYILVPTTLLLKEVSSRLSSMGSDFVAYHGRMKKAEKEEARERIISGDYRILVTTTAFLTKNFPLLKGKKFHFLFVDDVDSLLKRSRNLEKVVSLVEGKGVLMVSTATGTRGYNTRILRERLNFDVGNMRNAVRNVVDIRARKDELSDIVRTMGSGGLIFVPRKEDINDILPLLTGFRVGVVTSEDKDAFEAFASGELDILVGVASPYGVLVRGIDMPERIRYAVFYGIPHFRVSLERMEEVGEKVVRILSASLSSIYPELRDMLRSGDVEGMRSLLSNLSHESLVTEDVVIENGYAIIPDVRTYIQASGRTSRLYSGGITKGASFLLDSEERTRMFEKRARVYDIEFLPMESVDIPSLIEEIDEDRRRLRERRETREVVEPALFIVESPNKARHIAHFFGKPNKRILGNAVVYEVSTGNSVLLIAPSLGHVTDLTTSTGYHGVLVNHTFIPVYSSIKRCRSCGYQFTSGSRCPVCGSTEIYDSSSQIELLRHLALETEKVLIGTDPDTEGEKIAWDLYNLLLPFAKDIRRAEFHEVTRQAILRAISSSREMKEDLVKAQIVRRIEDRWIGFEFSSILKRRFREGNLSAGRAQTPTLGWIIERYDESRRVRKALFIKGTDVQVPWKVKPGRIKVHSVLVSREERERSVPPYTTDTLLRDASTILRLGGKRTMEILQGLFESGLITYHRTDSTHVSDEGLKVARIFLGEDFRPRRWGKEGAHECIRPTKPMSVEDIRRYVEEGMLSPLEEDALKLYDLVFRRFMASQSSWVEEVRKYRLDYGGVEVEAEIIVAAHGRGYELYPYATKLSTDLGEGEIVLEVEERIVSPRPFTQGELVARMKERGIGRPSTYATILDKLFKRKFVVEKKGRLIPTGRGRRVYSFLMENYSSFLSEERTRLLEEKMDAVERGERDYQEVLRELYEEMGKVRGK